MADWPTGNVTFLFTDMEGSTRLLSHAGERYADLLETHRLLIRRACRCHDGTEFGTEGDALFFSFQSPPDAVAAAVDAQVALSTHAWPTGCDVRVRMGIHTGPASIAAGSYVGLAVHASARIAAAGHGGQIVVSGSAAGAFEEGGLPNGVTLHALGQHRLKDLERAEWLFQVGHPDLPAAFPALRTMATLANNLPAEATSFVGRAQVIDDLDAALRQGKRVLSLVGPGGCGKSRLALHLAAACAHRYPDGVWLAELASVSADSLVDQTLAGALGIQEEPGRAMLETIAARLQSARTLIVLDNCEHLLDRSAMTVQALVDSCPNLQVLVTSREALGVHGETIWPVLPLSLPHQADGVDAEVIRDSEAVLLFIDRAQSARPDFVPEASDLQAIGTICRRLDGIPLAIELAAAKVSVLGLAEINERLDDRFRLLTGGSRTSLPRQQTLRAMVDWSHDLLDDGEQVLLRRLSVFGGSHTLDAVEAVAGFTPLPKIDVLDILARLVAKSLVVMDTSGARARYRMLETIRQYAARKLRESGEGEELRARHRQLWAAFAEVVDREHMGAEGPRWHDRVELELPNIRAALDSALTTPGAEREALDICGRLGLFFWLRGHTNEGRSWAERALSVDDATNPVVRSRALLTVGILAFTDLDIDAAKAALRESLRLAQASDEEVLAGWAMVFLGLTLATAGEFADGRQLLDDALQIARRFNVGPNLAGAHYFMGSVCSMQGDRAGAAEHLEAALHTARDVGAPYVLVRVLPVVATKLAGEDSAAARALFAEALELAHATHDRVGVARALLFLSEADTIRGELLSARGHLGSAVPVVEREIDDAPLSVRVELALARLDRIGGQLAAAASRLRRAMESATRLGHARELADVHHAIAALAFVRGDPATAEVHADEAVTLAGEANLSRRKARDLLLVGQLALERGELDRAQKLLAESSSLRVAGGASPSRLAANRHAEGLLALARGHTESALALLQHAVIARAAVGHRIAGAESMEALASVHSSVGETTQAAILLGAADGLRAAVGAPVPPAFAVRRRDLVESVKASMPGPTFAELSERGRVAGLDVHLAPVAAGGRGDRTSTSL